MFSAKCSECKIEKRDGHGKLRTGHGKVMEKYFVKSVGTFTFTIAYIYISNRFTFRRGEFRQITPPVGV